MFFSSFLRLVSNNHYLCWSFWRYLIILPRFFSSRHVTMVCELRRRATCPSKWGLAKCAAPNLVGSTRAFPQGPAIFISLDSLKIPRVAKMPPKRWIFFGEIFALNGQPCATAAGIWKRSYSPLFFFALIPMRMTDTMWSEWHYPVTSPSSSEYDTSFLPSPHQQFLSGCPYGWQPVQQ